jgi:ketosteroid isomerase-like protein/dienelactone hydrolase
MRHFLIILITGLSLFVRAQPTFTAADSLAVVQLCERYRTAWLAGDSTGVLGCFEEQARLSPNGNGPVEGKAAMRQFWFPNDSSKTLIHGFDNPLVELSGEGDMAFSTQKTWLDWSYIKGSTRMGKEQRGYAHAVYRRQSTGEWKIWRQSWTDVWARTKPEAEIGKSAPAPAKWPPAKPKSGKLFPSVQIDTSPEHLARLREINRDIWQPFSEAYAANDAEKYLQLHIPEFIRANGGQWAGVRNLSEYGVSVRKNFTQNQAEGRKAAIDFTFFERTAGPDMATERGVYRYTSFETAGTQYYYGQFHVFHRKIGGKWKIAVDYDSDESGTIGRDNFEAGWPTDVLSAAELSQNEAVVFHADDGVAVYATLFFARPESAARKNDPTILLFHQAQSNGLAEYKNLIPKLLTSGYNLLVADLREGGDKHGGQNRTAQNWKNASPDAYCLAAKDLEASLKFIENQGFTGKKILWGSGYSGALTIDWATRHPAAVAGVLAFAPAQGGSIVPCEPNENRLSALKIPLLVFRAKSEMAAANRQAQAALFQKFEVPFVVVESDQHGSLVLDPTRNPAGTDAAWKIVLEFLRNSCKNN